MQTVMIACVTAVLGLGALTKQQESSFSQLDFNNDDYISAEESAVNILLAAEFKELDVNQDGKLSREEFASFKG